MQWRPSIDGMYKVDDDQDSKISGSRPLRADLQLVTLWIASAKRFTFPVVIPATEILPSLVAYTECYIPSAQ